MSKAFVTQPAPEFDCKALLPSGEFGQVKLSDFKGKYVVLFFYPFDFTFVCPTEIIAFSDRAEEFRKIGCEVLGASTDSIYAHHAWVAIHRKHGGIGPNINIPLLADPTHTLTKDYGCYLEKEGHALRGLFIINKDGILKHALHNSPEAGRSVDETLRLVQAYQYADVHGEVCPAGWKPGSATIKPTPQQKGEFFGANYQ